MTLTKIDKYKYEYIRVDKKGRMQIQIYSVCRKKRANKNMNIFGLTKNWEYKKNYILFEEEKVQI